MAEINFELYNNQLVQQLVGPQDANLKLIEQLLNVTIGSFGNQITIQGNGVKGIGGLCTIFATICESKII